MVNGEGNTAQLLSLGPVFAALLLLGGGSRGNFPGLWKLSLLSLVVLTLDSVSTQFFAIWGMFYNSIPGLKQKSYSVAEI